MSLHIKTMMHVFCMYSDDQKWPLASYKKKVIQKSLKHAHIGSFSLIFLFFSFTTQTHNFH